MQATLGIWGRIAACYQTALITSLLAFVALLLGLSHCSRHRAKKSRRST
jgi:hypothetical protein